MAQPDWVLRQLNPNFFSLKIGKEETWVHFLHFSGRRQQVDQAVNRFLAGSDLVLPRKTMAEMDCYTLPTQKLAVFHPPMVGRKVDLGEFQDCLDAIGFLSRFHRDMRDFSCDPRPRVSLGRQTASWVRRRKRMNEFARLSRCRLFPGIMDRVFQACFKKLEDQVQMGIEALEKTDYAEYAGESGQVCYFHFHSEFFWRYQGRIAPWHFAFCHWDLPIVDLYRFVLGAGRRPGMSGKLMRLIEAYHAVRPISREEQKILHALLLFPERLVRLYASFYLNRTTRAPRIQMERIKQEEIRDEEREKLAKQVEMM